MNTLPELLNAIPFAPHASAKYVWAELMRRGWELTVLRANVDEQYVLVMAKRGEQSFFTTELKHLLYTPLNDRQSYFLSANKSRTAAILDHFGLSYPRNVFELRSDEIDKLRSYQVSRKLVVKPHASYGGKGVSFVTDQDEIEAAVKKALQYSATALVQEYAEGEEHRILMIDGAFVAAFRSRPACVRGDGTLTVRQLIEQKNTQKADKNYQGTRSTIKLDRAIAFLAERGVDWTPALDELVILDSISNISFGGDAIDVTDDVNQELIRHLSILCRSTSLGVAGIDVISSDISSSDMSRHKVTEINGCPGLRPHVLVEEGISRNVATPYVDALEKFVQIR